MIAFALYFLVVAAPGFQDLTKAFDAARNESKWKEVRAAADELSKLNDGRVTRWMMNEMRLAGDHQLRRILFRALVYRKGPHQAQLVEQSLGSEDPFFRATSLEAFAQIDPEKATQRAADLLSADMDRRVRRSAVTVLLQVKTPRALRILLDVTSTLPAVEQTPIVAMLSTVPTDRLAKAVALSPAKESEQLLLAMLMAKRGDETFKPALEKFAASKNRHLRLVAAAGLARLKGDDKALALNRLLKVKSLNDRYDLYDLIARAGLFEKVFRDALIKAARSGDKRIRAKAAEALGAIGGKHAVPVLAPLLRVNKPWQVPIGAARGLARSRVKEAIPPLIEALKVTQARLQNEVATALESLTGQPFGRQIAVWEGWWHDKQAQFEVPRIEPALWVEETAASDNYAFYGIQIVSDRAAFVCDISGSMEGKSLETLKRELTKVVKRFPPKGKFNLVFFNEKVAAWKRKLVEAKPRAREKALELIGGLKAGGATNIWDALALALDDKDVDTIVLLSDGAPTAGKLRTPRKITEEFLARNRERMVVLHVVSIGQAARFLEFMSKQSGGQYVEVK